MSAPAPRRPTGSRTPRRRLTRREALAGAGAVGLGALLAGCGAGSGDRAAASGSTLRSTWGDPVGDGQLRVLGGEGLRARTDLGPAAAPRELLATFAHVTDAHVLDASSPARVPFLNRLGPPFQSTFRPQETLTAQVLGGAVRAVRALAPDLVIQGGDLIDNVQFNELDHALAVLAGRRVSPGSGSHGYYGVQLSWDADPFYYRPAVDAPVHPTLLRDAIVPFQGPSIGAPLAPVFGDHDALVAGTFAPTALTRSLAVGDKALWNLPTDLTLPRDLSAENSSSPDGPPDPGAIGGLLAQALRGPTVRVPADGDRRQLPVAESVATLRAAGASAVVSRTDGHLDYLIDHGADVRVIVLDVARRGGGSGGEVVAGQAQWVARALASAGQRWVIVVSHQPLASSVGAGELLARLARAPRVVAVLNGHIHRNQITPVPTSAGGYWQITTSSLIDYPQQARALALHATADGGVSLTTWMLDHAGDGRLGDLSRQLSYLDAQGGRPEGFSGTPLDRNVVLHRRAVGA
jgi:3',5'-cyclic AMP phosphodiesterase CpdA